MELPAAKRQKVLIACEPCRNRKVKCDGVTPVCGPCGHRARKTNTLCTWSDSSHSPDAQMQALKDRIAFLESRLEPLAAIGEAEQDDSRSIPRLPTGPPDLMANEDVQHTASSPAHAAGQANHSSPIYPIIGPTESDESGEGFFGSSSAGTFMQSVNALVEQRLRGKVAHRAPILQPFGSGLVVPRSPGRQPPRVNPAEHSLPLRKVANELMDVYWQAVHSMLPILDRRQTQLQYESLWTGEGEFANQSRFLCLVNAMFALSCQLNPAEQPPERALMASTYYSRAMSLLDVWQTPSLRTVQSLVLLAMFSQSSNEPHQCWILTGIAIRVSQALGIHLPETGERGKGTQSRELIRLVWHACVQLGRTVSMTYGRPCGVGERLAAGLPFPLPADCEHDLGVPVTTTEYFNLSTKLYQDLHEVLYSLCAPGVIQVRSLDELYDRYFRHVTSDPTKPSIIDIDGDLQRWHDSIPDKLKASAFDVASEESVIHRQAVILEQNYLHIRLLLLRPFLCAVITLNPGVHYTGKLTASTPLSIKISLQCAITCVKIAQDAIDMIHSHRARVVGNVGNTATWWFNVLFVYTAATVLNASLLCPSIVEELSEAAILESWRRALAVLEEYTVFGDHITRLVTTLRVLSDTVRKPRSKHHGRRTQQELRVQSRPLATSSATSQATSHTVQSITQPSAATVTQPHSDLYHLPLIEESFDSGLSMGGLFNLDFDQLDLAWLMSLPASL